MQEITNEFWQALRNVASVAVGLAALVVCLTSPPFSSMVGPTSFMMSAAVDRLSSMFRLQGHILVHEPFGRPFRQERRCCAPPRLESREVRLRALPQAWRLRLENLPHQLLDVLLRRQVQEAADLELLRDAAGVLLEQGASLRPRVGSELSPRLNALTPSKGVGLWSMLDVDHDEY